MTDTQRYCAECGAPFNRNGRTTRRDACEKCGAELHACINCHHYDATLARSCREPSAVAEETVRDVRRGNLCDWFDHRRGPPSGDDKSSGERARAAFDALFKGAKVEDPGRVQAEELSLGL